MNIDYTMEGENILPTTDYDDTEDVIPIRDFIKEIDISKTLSEIIKIIQK